MSLLQVKHLTQFSNFLCIIGQIMDTAIKKVKKKNDKEMNKLVKMDIKRDKVCDKAMEKKKK